MAERYTYGKWTENEDKVLRQLITTGDNMNNIAEKLGRSLSSVSTRASKMGYRSQSYREGKGKVKNCHKCKSEFYSPHRGIWFCDPCREKVTNLAQGSFN